ncbi:hypothetical protein RNZ50_05060 [Paracoccaceae bacterium Fryx2]|nr:hypothetical protein [Paracoccaceae bacterium Fryx2]
MSGAAMRSDVTETTQGSYVDWAAILGGAVVAVALGALFTGFGAALGLTAISAEEGEGSGLLAVIISAVWVVLSMIAAYATGGYVAGRMRRRVESATPEEVTVRDGMNGVIVWAVGIVLSVILLGSAVTGLVSTAGKVAATGAEVAGSIAGGAAGGAMTAASNLMPDDPMDFVTGTLLRPTTVQPDATQNEATSADAASILANVMTTGEISDSDRAYLVQLTAARAGVTPPEVEARVDQAVASAQAARDEAARMAAEAEETARNAAEMARISGILTAFLLTATALVAAAAAYVSAVKGGRHRDDGRIFGGFAYRG